jgi:hypothetical protein
MRGYRQQHRQRELLIRSIDRCPPVFYLGDELLEREPILRREQGDETFPLFQLGFDAIRDRRYVPSHFFHPFSLREMFLHPIPAGKSASLRTGFDASNPIALRGMWKF